MIGVPGGGFRGSSPQMAVAPFCIDVNEVTVDEYKACVEARKCTADGVTCEGDYTVWANWGVAGRGRHPMNCVSYEQALGYCMAMGKRLPAIHEWEWEARGGLQARKYPWGNDAPSQARMCWQRSSTPPMTCPIGSYPSGDSLHGLHDMVGNVSEWMSDTASGWRNLKGGTPGTRDEDLQVEHQMQHWPGNKPERYPRYGIRCAMTP
jgi:formylglycine-generating enzyme required for sulfatase activity